MVSWITFLTGYFLYVGKRWSCIIRSRKNPEVRDFGDCFAVYGLETAFSVAIALGVMIVWVSAPESFQAVSSYLWNKTAPVLPLTAGTSFLVGVAISVALDWVAERKPIFRNGRGGLK